MTASELRKIREELGWTQKQLAEAVGIAPNNIACQERGEIGISEPVARLLRLIAAGVDVETLINPRGGRKDASHKPSKSAGSRTSKSTSRQKDHVQGKRH